MKVDRLQSARTSRVPASNSTRRRRHHFCYHWLSRAARAWERCQRTRTRRIGRCTSSERQLHPGEGPDKRLSRPKHFLLIKPARVFRFQCAIIRTKQHMQFSLFTRCPQMRCDATTVQCSECTVLYCKEKRSTVLYFAEHRAVWMCMYCTLYRTLV